VKRLGVPSGPPTRFHSIRMPLAYSVSDGPQEKKESVIVVRNCLSVGYVILVMTTVVIGCGRGTDRCAVSGSVTLGGQPVDPGSVQFAPMGNNQASASGAPIIDGSYSIGRDGGLLPGKYLVRIYWPEKNTLGQGRGVPLPKERVPAKYNINSELTVEVQSGADNQFDFNL